jgi:hypothetical protein
VGPASASAQQFVFCNFVVPGTTAYANFPNRGASTIDLSYGGCHMEQAEPGEPYLVDVYRSLDGVSRVRHEIGPFTVPGGPTRVTVTGSFENPYLVTEEW